MRMLKNVKRMIATVLSVTTCLTPGLVVSANGGSNKAITIQIGSSNLKKLPLIYNDDYFNKSAFEYNESLATASLALELSGFADRLDYSDQAKNAKKALGELGFGDIQENDGYKQKTTADSIGVLAASKKIKSNNEEYTLIPVVIRGGGYENEWGGNAKVGKSGDHEGFNTAATKAKAFVDDYIKDKKIQGKVKLWIVGYSRGGATASLLGVKYNNDFTSTLNELDKDSKNFSNEDYYNSYVNKERKRTLNKYGSEIEMNPNDLYVYTFEAPMGMNIINGSGLKEYKGNIPYSKSEKSDKAIYENIHNTINDDDFVTKVAPKDWGFARPGVDHKLLEGRKDSDVKNMEAILHEFLINKVSKAKWDKKSEEEKKKSKEYAVRYVDKLNASRLQGINNYSELGDNMAGIFNRALTRVRGSKLSKDWQYKTNRAFFADRYQETVSKLAVSIMSKQQEFSNAKNDILGNCKVDIARLGAGAAFNTNYIDAPFNNIVDRFSKDMKISLSTEERQAILDLAKGLDHNTELPFLFYAFVNASATFKMHQPELHLATLISKDKNKSLYIEQMKKINNDYFNEINKIQNEIDELMNDNDDWKDCFDDAEIEKVSKEKKEDKKSEFVDEFEDLTGEIEKNSNFINNFEDMEEEANEVKKKDAFVQVDKDNTEYGLKRAEAFLKQRSEKEEATKKGFIRRVVGTVGKGVKTGFRFVFSPRDEIKNMIDTTTDWGAYKIRRWFK